MFPAIKTKWLWDSAYRGPSTRGTASALKLRDVHSRLDPYHERTVAKLLPRLHQQPLDESLQICKISFKSDSTEGRLYLLHSNICQCHACRILMQPNPRMNLTSILYSPFIRATTDLYVVWQLDRSSPVERNAMSNQSIGRNFCIVRGRWVVLNSATLNWTEDNVKEESEDFFFRWT